MSIPCATVWHQVLLPCTGGRVRPHCRSRQSSVCVGGRNRPFFHEKTFLLPLLATFSVQSGWIFCNWSPGPENTKWSLQAECCSLNKCRKMSLKCTTHPGSDLALPKPALLSDFVWASKLLHVFAEVTLSAVLCPSTGLTLPTHSDRPFHLGALQKWVSFNALYFNTNNTINY